MRALLGGVFCNVKIFGDFEKNILREKFPIKIIKNFFFQITNFFNFEFFFHVLVCIVLYLIVLYFFVLYCILLYCILFYCIVFYCIVFLYCIASYCILLYCILNVFTCVQNIYQKF